jgi:DNA-binding HxlR family transcriptional regulator
MGDRWTLLIMLEIGLGARRFDEIQAYTGMSSNLLASRLKELEKHRILKREKYSEHPPRFEYRATQKGKELDAVILAIRGWGIRWCGYDKSSAPAMQMTYRTTGEMMDALWQPPRTNDPFTFEEVDVLLSAEYLAERDAKSIEFKRRRNGA